MPARRCSNCGECWPNDATEYAQCPRCEIDTYHSAGNDPMDATEALSLKRHLDFDRYCAKRDAEQAQLTTELEALLELGESL